MPSQPLAELLARVDEHALWSATARGTHLWPIVRSAVLRASLRRDLDTSPGASQRRRSAGDTLRAWSHAVPEGLRALRAATAPRGDALFFVPTVLFVPEAEGVGHVDRLYDPYYRRLRRPTVVELSTAGHASRGRGKSAPDVVSFPSLWSAARAAALLLPWSADDDETVRAFANEVVGAFDLPAAMAGALADKLTSHARTCPHLERILERRLMGRCDTRVAFVHTASYLGTYGLVSRALKRHDFHIVELQHGSTHPEHYAYHFSPDVLASSEHPARAYLPDDLVLYGDHWASQVTSPSRKVVVGYPYLAGKLEQAGPDAGGSDQALVVLQGSSTRDTLPAIAKEVAEAMPHLLLVVKTHPGEASDPDGYPALRQLPNVRVVGRRNVYDLLAECSVVIGYSSTVLYEAAAYSGKRVFVLRNPYVSSELGDHFETSEQLVQWIDEPDRGRSRLSSPELFEPDWRPRLEDYLREIGLHRA